MLISELAEKVGVHPETIRRLERRGVIPRATRDCNGWRRYPPEAVDTLRKLYGDQDGDKPAPEVA